jgi:hypothetical protein
VNIYLAGKISCHGWREDLYRYRGVSFSISDWTHDWPVEEGVLSGGHNLTGPFFISCDHGCGHGPHSHGVGFGSGNGTPTDEDFVAFNEVSVCISGSEQEIPKRRQVVLACLRAIRRSDLVFAWIDSEDAFGTFAEIGMALASGVPVSIAVAPNVDPRNIWFLVESAVHRSIPCGSPLEGYLNAVLAVQSNEMQIPPWLGAVRASAEALSALHGALIDHK